MYSKKVHRLNLSLAQLLPKCVLLLSLCKSQATKTTSNPYFLGFALSKKPIPMPLMQQQRKETASQLASLWPILKETGEGRSKSTKPTHCVLHYRQFEQHVGAQSIVAVAHGAVQAAAAAGIAKMQVNVRQRLHDLLRTWATPNKRLGFRVCQNGGKKVRSC